MSNRSVGNAFENEFAELLSSHCFWVHLLKQNNSGQPADVIAARNGKAYLIDCKVCSNGEFALSRVEENQDLAMSMWASRGNGEGWFALKVNEQVYMLPRVLIAAYKNCQSKLSYNEIRELGKTFERWVAKCK